MHFKNTRRSRRTMRSVRSVRWQQCETSRSHFYLRTQLQSNERVSAASVRPAGAVESFPPTPIAEQPNDQTTGHPLLRSIMPVSDTARSQTKPWLYRNRHGATPSAGWHAPVCGVVDVPSGSSQRRRMGGSSAPARSGWEIHFLLCSAARHPPPPARIRFSPYNHAPVSHPIVVTVNPAGATPVMGAPRTRLRLCTAQQRARARVTFSWKAASSRDMSTART